MNKLQILIKPTSEWTKRNDIAIHTLKPTVDELTRHIEDADAKGFDLIVMYSDKREQMQNIFASQSTWNQLRRIYGDVRYGEIAANSSTGEGFKIYFDNWDVA